MQRMWGTRTKGRDLGGREGAERLEAGSCRSKAPGSQDVAFARNPAQKGRGASINKSQRKQLRLGTLGGGRKPGRRGGAAKQEETD